MKKIIAITLAALMALSLFAGCSSAPETAGGANTYKLETVKEGYLTVITSPDYAPYEFYALDAEGNPTLAGFDIALGQYIADFLGLELEIITMDGSFGWCSEDPYAVTVGRKGGGITRQSNAFGGGFSTTFGDAIAAFYASLASGVKDEWLASFRDGLAAVKLCEAMKKSAQLGGQCVSV